MAEARVVVAADSFGGFLSAPDACERIATGLRDAGLQVRTHPMSDGGEGFLDALGAHRNLELHGLPIPGPLGAPTFATAGRLDSAWIVESAEAIGLHLCGETRMPGRASSVGLGLLVQDLARRATGPFIVGLGGSATVDAGLGLAQGLGLTALDAQGRQVPQPGGATALTGVRRLVGPQPMTDRITQVLCDVRTPLADAAARFGPQKGVQPSDIAPLTAAHLRWADTLNRWRQDHGLSEVDASQAGSGAAGGLGLALNALVGGHLIAGAGRFSRMTDLRSALKGANVVVIGEGRLDATSYAGKVAEVVSTSARAIGATILAVVGDATDVPPAPAGPDQVIVAGETPDRDAAMHRAIADLVQAIALHRP